MKARPVRKGDEVRGGVIGNGTIFVAKFGVMAVLWWNGAPFHRTIEMMPDLTHANGDPIDWEASE